MPNFIFYFVCILINRVLSGKIYKGFISFLKDSVFIIPVNVLYSSTNWCVSARFPLVIGVTGNFQYHFYSFHKILRVL